MNLDWRAFFQLVGLLVRWRSKHNATEGDSFISFSTITMWGERISTFAKKGIVADIAHKLHGTRNHNPTNDYVAIRSKINEVYPGRFESYLCEHFPNRHYTRYRNLLGGENERWFDVYIFD